MRVDAPDTDAMEAFGRSLADAAARRRPRRAHRAARRRQDHADPWHRRGPRRARPGAEPHLRARAHAPEPRRRTAARARRRVPARQRGRARRPRHRLRPVGRRGRVGRGHASTASRDSWLEVDIERPERCAGDEPTDAADAELLGAERAARARGARLRPALGGNARFASRPVGWIRCSSRIDTSAGTPSPSSIATAVCSPRAGTDDTMRHAEVVGRLIRDALAEAGVARRATLGRRRAAWAPARSRGCASASPPRARSRSAAAVPFVPVVSHDAVASDWYRGGRLAADSMVVTDARRREFAVLRLRRPRRRRPADPRRRPGARAARRGRRVHSRGTRLDAAPRAARRPLGMLAELAFARGPAAARRRRAAVPALARRHARRPAEAGELR